jgi:hypothetical protein
LIGGEGNFRAEVKDELGAVQIHRVLLSESLIRHGEEENCKDDGNAYVQQ